METTSGVKKALVITGGYCNTDAVRRQIPAAVDLIVAADSGYATALKLGIQPDIAVGDFDSYGKELPKELATMKVPCEKDVTDTMLACEYAKDNGCREILIIGGTGGRVDHAISNVFYLEALRREGVFATLTDGENTVRILTDETVRIPADNVYFSVFAFDECTVTESGCKYPLKDARLVRERPYALSNEVTAEEAVLTVRGTAAFVISRK